MIKIFGEYFEFPENEGNLGDFLGEGKCLICSELMTRSIFVCLLDSGLGSLFYMIN